MSQLIHLGVAFFAGLLLGMLIGAYLIAMAMNDKNARKRANNGGL